MRISILTLALLIAGNFADDPDAKKEQDRLQGDWPVVSCKIGDRELPSPDGDNLMTFEGDQLALVWNGKQPKARMTIKLDPTTKPARIELSAPGGITFKGIYELDGKRLRICYNKDKWPSAFDAKEQGAAPHNVLYELKRE